MYYKSSSDTTKIIGIPPRIRTLTSGFGDRYAAITLGIHYYLERLERFELPTAGFEDQNSSTELQTQILGGNGEIRTHTGQRMKLLHNHYATLPYRNTLLKLSMKESNLLPRATLLDARFSQASVFLYGRGTGNRTLIDQLKAGYSSR